MGELSSGGGVVEEAAAAVGMVPYLDMAASCWISMRAVAGAGEVGGPREYAIVHDKVKRGQYGQEALGVGTS